MTYQKNKTKFEEFCSKKCDNCDEETIEKSIKRIIIKYQWNVESKKYESVSLIINFLVDVFQCKIQKSK